MDGEIPKAKDREIWKIRKARVIGRKFFHIKCISWSYRNRGYDARTHKNVNTSIIVFIVIEVEK